MIQENGYRIYSITEEPFRIHGLAVTDAKNRQFYRLPLYMLEKMPQYQFLGRRVTGGRVRFVTNSKTFLVRMTLACAKEDINIPLSGSAGADIYLGKGQSAVYLGYIAPAEHTMSEITVEKAFTKKEELELVTIELPRNDLLLAMEVGVEETAVLEKAPDYEITKPMVFYGSSITEGGCASRVGNAYTSIVSRLLDADYYNYGFSGSARGEKEFAEYIAGISDMSVFVYDYDHNSPSVEHLSETHEPFFKIIREKHPALPVVMMSRPDVDKNIESSKQRAEVVRKTYENARKAGDEQVYFIDGSTFFGAYGRAECTVDGTHPNALGFMRMAEKLYPVLRQILK